MRASRPTVALLMSGGCGRVLRWRPVEEGSGAERVEIQLTSRDNRRDARRGRRRNVDVLDPLAGPPAAPGDAQRVDVARGEHDGPAFAAPLAGSDGLLSGERRRLRAAWPGVSGGAVMTIKI